MKPFAAPLQPNWSFLPSSDRSKTAQAENSTVSGKVTKQTQYEVNRIPLSQRQDVPVQGLHHRMAMRTPHGGSRGEVSLSTGPSLDSLVPASDGNKITPSCAPLPAATAVSTSTSAAEGASNVDPSLALSPLHPGADWVKMQRRLSEARVAVEESQALRWGMQQQVWSVDRDMGRRYGNGNVWRRVPNSQRG